MKNIILILLAVVLFQSCVTTFGAATNEASAWIENHYHNRPIVVKKINSTKLADGTILYNYQLTDCKYSMFTTSNYTFLQLPDTIK